MATTDSSPSGNGTQPFLDGLRAAAQLLESIVADRGLLATVSEPDRRRLLDAVALVFHPDAVARRKLVKATVRIRKQERVARDESALADTGIRKLRRQPVFTSPNVFPPTEFEQRDVNDD